MNTFQKPDMSKHPDLYSFSCLGMPAAEPSKGSLPPIVSAMFSDYDGIWARAVIMGGFCSHPQMVAAITAECKRYYLNALILSDIEAGAAAVYGAILFRGASYVHDAVDVVVDSMNDQDDRLSHSDVRLLAHASGLALSSRDTSILEPKSLGAILNDYERARSIAIADNRLPEWSGIESKYTAFARYREMIDEVKRATDGDAPLDPSFFSSLEPSTENYIKGVFGLLSKSGSEIQKSALEYFARLDPALLVELKFGLEHNYMND